MKRIYILFFLILFALPCYAHPGRTDEYGGHNSPNGYYHYHHGYPAHSHYRKICPYKEAELAYDTSYPWEYDAFLEEYTDGFDLGYDIGVWYGGDDGYASYHKNSDLFDPWTEYDEDELNYPQESPYAYGYCDGYRLGYCISFEESYNWEALDDVNDEDCENYWDEEIKEILTYEYTQYDAPDSVSIKSPQPAESHNKVPDVFEIILFFVNYGFDILLVVFCIWGFINFFKELQ